MMSVDSLFNVLLLLMLIFFIMAVLGNVLFLDVFEGNVISDYKNFTNFHQSFSLRLFCFNFVNKPIFTNK